MAKQTEVYEVTGVPQVVGAVQALRQGLLDLRKTLPTWRDEELAELFAETADLEGAFYAARCYICHLLAQRHGGAEDSGGLRAAARILGISYAYARELSSIWGTILARLEDGFPALPAGFFSRALRARHYGVDPAEAIRHAVHVTAALNHPYSVRQFEQDIRHGLPARDGSPIPSCSRCSHYVLGRGRLVLIGDDGSPLAEAETEGARYCNQYGLLRSGLGDVRVRAESCPHYQLRDAADTTTAGGSGLS